MGFKCRLDNWSPCTLSYEWILCDGSSFSKYHGALKSVDCCAQNLGWILSCVTKLHIISVFFSIEHYPLFRAALRRTWSQVCETAKQMQMLVPLKCHEVVDYWTIASYYAIYLGGRALCLLSYREKKSCFGATLENQIKPVDIWSWKNKGKIRMALGRNRVRLHARAIKGPPVYW